MTTGQNDTMPDSTSTPLDIKVERTDGGVTLLVNGEIDLESSALLSDALVEVSTASRVHLDLTHVGYMDSTGLRAVLVAREEIEGRGGTLDIVAASSIVHRLIEITGLAELLGKQPSGS